MDGNNNDRSFMAKMSFLVFGRFTSKITSANINEKKTHNKAVNSQVKFELSQVFTICQHYGGYHLEF